MLLVWLAVAASWSPPPKPSEELKRQVTTLAAQLSAEETAVRQRATDDLLRLGPPAAEVLVPILSKSDPRLQQAIRTLLPRYGPPAIDHLCISYRSAPYDPMVREEAQKAVATMGVVVISELDRLLDSEGVFAFNVLRRLGPLAVPKLIDLLKHPERDVRRNAVMLLASLADPRSADAILEGLKSKDAGVRSGAAKATGRLQDGRAIPLLLGLLSDPTENVREEAAVALGRMYREDFLEPLATLARTDRDAGVRNVVSKVLLSKRATDRTAERLGRRYKPINFDPVATEALQFFFALYLTATGAAVYALAWLWVRFWGAGRWLRVPWAVWAAGLGALLLGLYWGRFATGVSARIELLLLCIAVPVGALVALTIGPVWKMLLVPAVCIGPVVGAFFAAAKMPSMSLTWLLVSFTAPWLLVGILGLMLLVVLWRFARLRDRSPLRPFVPATVVTIGLFYAGYGAGWLWLWSR